MADRKTLSVVVPCLNEAPNVPALAERLFNAVDEVGLTTELVVVDDGSSDSTWAAIQGLRAMYGDRVTGVRHPANRGIAAAWRSGIDHAQGTYVCFMDGDLQNSPEQVVTLYRRLLETSRDVAQGIRSSIGRQRDSRLAYSRVLNAVLNVLFGMRAKDNKSGFVLAPRRVMDDLLTYRHKYSYFQSFIGVAAKAKGYSIVEVETLFDERRSGTSFLRGNAIRVSLEAARDLAPAFAEFRLGARSRTGAVVAPKFNPLLSTKHPYHGWRRLLFETYWLTMPLHTWLIRRRSRDIYLELKHTEWLPADEMRALQGRKLQRLIQHAYVHVPYYRDAMRAAGVQPEDIETSDDIVRLPLLSKDDVRRRLFFELFADNHRKRDMHRIATSGSTGEPFVTYADRHQLEVRFATTLRAMEWTGWRFGDRQARLWHQTLGMTTYPGHPRADRCPHDATDVRAGIRDIRREPRALHRLDSPAQARARRRLRRVAELHRHVCAARRQGGIQSEGGDVVRAGAAGLGPPDHRSRIEHDRVRQIRES